MEALVLIVDVSLSAASRPSDGDDSFLANSARCVDRILQRKIFAEKCRDHVALVVQGSAITDNPLADDDQFQHIALVRRLAPVNWKFVEDVKDDLKPSSCEGDWLDAVVVAMDHLENSLKTHKYSDLKIVLFTDFAGPLCQDNLDVIMAGLKQRGIDLTVIGPDLGLDDDEEEDEEMDGAGEPQPGPSRQRNSKRNFRLDGKPKTTRQLEGEQVAAKLIQAVDGASFTFRQAVPQLLFFHKRKFRPAPWNAPLQIGNNLTIPITGYSKIKKAVPPTWKKMMVGADGDSRAEQVKQERMYHQQDADRTEVAEADTIRAYRYGTTIVPFSKEDEAEMRYNSGAPRSLQVLGFTAASNVSPHMYLDTQTVYIVPRRGDAAAETALSALIHALEDTNMVAIARRQYNANFQPRLGALLPRIRDEVEALVWVQLPYCEDVRNPMFAPLPETPGSQEQLDAVDRLIDSMDLTAPDMEEVEERLAPENVLNPHFQRLFQVLSHRALRPDAPLPPVEDDLRQMLSPDPTMITRSLPILDDLKRLFPLEEVTQPHQKRETGRDVFPQVQPADAALPSNVTSVSDVTGARVTEIGTVTPTEDFGVLIARDDVDFTALCAQMQRVILRLVMESSVPALVNKAIAAIRCLRHHCVRIAPQLYNSWLRDNRAELASQAFIWEGLETEQLGLITSEEGEHPAASQAEAEEFFRPIQPQQAAAEQQPAREDAEDLLDEL